MAKDEEITFNFSLTAKQKKQLAVAVLVLIPLFLAIFFRAYPATLPITDTWAESSVENFYKQQLSAQLRQDFPNLPDQQLTQRINENYEQLLKANSGELQTQIEGTSQQFKAQMQNNQGETYLLAIDPWFYLQAAENLEANGHTGTSFKNDISWDDRLRAPLGNAADHNLHSNIILIVWTIMNWFTATSIMGASFWVPLIIASLATIPAFFLARRRAGNLGGFIAASIVAVHTTFLGRTPAGFSDTDAYNVFFPLLVAWLFLEAFHAKELWKKLSLAAGAGVALGIYSKAWIGYWYILDILIAVVIGYLAFIIVKHFYQNYKKSQNNKKTQAFFTSKVWGDVRQTLLLFVVFYIALGIVASLLIGFSKFLAAPLGFLNFAQLKNAVNPSLWPNVLTTVAELNEVNFGGVVNQMGGKFLYWLALMGVAVSILPKKLSGRHLIYLGIATLITLLLISGNALGFSPITYLILLGIPLAIGLLMILNDEEQADIKYAMLLLVWFIAAMYTTTKGVRFTLVLVPTFAVAIGTIIGIAHQYFTKILAQELEIPKKIVIPVLALIFCLVLVSPIKDAHAVALSEVPSMNDGWYESLTKIRDNSTENAIITSWWDFGHWFKAIAERPVTFDGGSQNTPMAHWVGKLLLTTNEDESRGILRMLNCGSRSGFDTLQEEVQDTVRTKKLMDEIILLDEATARTRLATAGVSQATIDAVLPLTHCTPPDSFLITSQDMVGKAGVWGHFGSWSFERAFIYNELRNKPQAEAVADMVARFGYSEEQALREYTGARSLTSESAANSWISPWPAYNSAWLACRKEIGSVNTTALGTNTSPAGELENRTLGVCSPNAQISSSQQGTVVVENIFIDLENPDTARFRYGIYSGNVRAGGIDEGKPKVMYHAHADGFERYEFEEPTSGLGLLYDEENDRMMFTDPLHTGSVFTQLFYLNGRYNENYELFSDRTTFNGQRVTVWKVNWD